MKGKISITSEVGFLHAGAVGQKKTKNKTAQEKNHECSMLSNKFYFMKNKEKNTGCGETFVALVW